MPITRPKRGQGVVKDFVPGGNQKRSQDNARANIVSGWNRKPGDVKASTRSVVKENKPSAREIKMYDRAFGETAADRTAAHAGEKKQAEARAREEAIRRAQQAARGRR